MKKFLQRSKLSLTIDLAIVALGAMLLIPATRQNTIAMMLRPTMFIHHIGLLAHPQQLEESTFDWQLFDLNGNKHSLSEYKGKVIFINYWASWCAPCLAETNQLQQLYSDYGSKVNFLFISNEEQQIVANYENNKKTGLPYFTPLTQYPNQLQTSSLPTTFIINKEGVLVMKKTGIAPWNGSDSRRILDSLLAE
ncbi:MAG: TlpA family protein disulfide reductase [Salinivirgaceae bacterium]|nr:TlpA family protein disulfide reductase [Salinivirgaceae bacterium]